MDAPPTANSPAPPLPEPEEMLLPSKVISKKPRLIFILVGILAALLLGSGAFWAGKNLGKPGSAGTLVSTPPPFQTPALQADDTANWQTYRNDYLGFEIKYPPQFDATENLSELNQGVVSLNDGDACSKINPNFYINFNNVYPQEKKTISSEEIEIAFTKTSLNVNELPDNDHCVVTGRFKVNDRLLAESSFKKNGVSWSIGAVIRKDNLAHELLLFKQILSTFRFLNQTNGNPTVSSPTPTVARRTISYRNIPGWPLYLSLLDFSFQYPPDYDFPQKEIVDFMNQGQFYCSFSTTKKVGTGLDFLIFKAIPKDGEDRVQRTLKILNAPGYSDKEEVKIFSYPATLLELDQSYPLFEKDQAVVIETDSMLLIGHYQQNEINQNWGYLLESIRIGPDFNKDFFNANLNSCRS